MADGILKSPGLLSATRAVVYACRLAAAMQPGRDGAGKDFSLAKSDESPVTVADFAVEALISITLSHGMSAPVKLLGEEGDTDLVENDVLRKNVVAAVERWAPPDVRVSEELVLEHLRAGGMYAPASKEESYFVLDPIDGTKGFLRGPEHQFAVGLAFVESGRPVLGVIGCPNLPFPSVDKDEQKGTLFAASEGQGAFMFPLDTSATDSPSLGTDLRDLLPRGIHLTADQTPKHRFCESYESGHSDHSLSSRIASHVGIVDEPPVRVDSMVKYGLLARGDAALYLRFPRKGYSEKVWDHAAGTIVLTEAGGTVVDALGKPLDFSHGRALQANTGLVASAPGASSLLQKALEMSHS